MKLNKTPININLLLHGKPGTGKTQFVTELAVLLKRDIYSVDIESIGKECYSGKSIYLIEEIDKVLSPNGEFIAEKQNNVDNLLQFLDGVLRPRKSVVVIITNDIGKVMSNNVLSRSGRITEMIEFGDLSEEQCKSLCNSLFPDNNHADLWNEVKSMGITIAELSTYVNNRYLQDIPFADIIANAKVTIAKNKNYRPKTSNHLYY